MSFKQVYGALAEREAARLDYTYPTHYPTPQHAFYTTARSAQNQLQNRYSNILAYDRTAILGDQGYLNANIISDGHQWWVASQAPTPQTFETWFKAIHDRSASKHPLLAKATPKPSLGESAILVQLTGWEERGMIKADRYLSAGTFGEVGVKVEEGEWREDIQSTVTRLMLNDMEVLHYHFKGWPDHGVPDGEGVKALRALILEIERIREGEVWVHCSAGVGRTGSFIAISSLIARSKGTIPIDPSPLGLLPGKLAKDPVASTVDQLREWRGMLVQGPQQLQLIYEMAQH